MVGVGGYALQTNEHAGDPFGVLHSTRGIDVVLLRGQLEHHAGSPRLERTLRKLTGRAGAKIILDFHGVTYCCSSAIGAILDASEEVIETGGVLVCAAVSGTARDAMDLLNIPDVIPCFRTTAEAFEALENDAVEPAAVEPAAK